MEDASIVMPIFDALKAQTKIDLRVSTLGVNIEDSVLGRVIGYYAFHSNGAVRLDVSLEGDVVQAAIWTAPGELNHPDYKVDLSQDDPLAQIPSIASAMGVGGSLQEIFSRAEGHLFHEGAKEDIQDFLKQVPDAKLMKGTEAYIKYMTWASDNQKKPVSSTYFGDTIRLLRSMPDNLVAASSPSPGVEPASSEKTAVEPTEEEVFVKQVMDNEIYIKAKMYESHVRRIARGDPGVTAIFVYGSPGLGKTFTAKKILKEEGVWDSKVVYKSGAIAGFTGLLQLLWDNRDGKIIVLDDNDSLLVGNINAANILKAALNTDPEDRLISYTKFRK